MVRELKMGSSNTNIPDLEDNYIESDEVGHDVALIDPEVRSCRCSRRRCILYAILGVAAALIVARISVLIYNSNKPTEFEKDLESHLTSETFAGKLNGLSPDVIIRELVEMHRLGGISDDASVELSKFLTFENFARNYNKNYEGITSKHAAFKNFRANLDIIKAHEANTDALYKKGLNHFSDMNLSEVASVLLHPIETIYKDMHNAIFLADLEKEAPKGEVITFEGINWRRGGIVSPVKDQKHCGSCWAFAAVASVESLILQETSKLHILSEQELVSCDSGSYGCNGGFSDLALQYITARGITTSNNWPYEGASGECEPHTGERHYIRNYVGATGYDVANKLLIRAPTVVYIAANEDLVLYSGGIYNGNCDDTHLNHAVLLVGEGYDAESDKRFWLLKNSWGEDWGEDGFFRLERTNNGNDKCGVLSVGFMPYGHLNTPPCAA